MSGERSKSVIVLYFLHLTKRMSVDSPLVDELLAQGWSTINTQADTHARHNHARNIVRKKLLGRTAYETPAGEYVGKLYADDPRIVAESLVIKYTDNQRATHNKRQAAATDAKLGAHIYNNGTEERFLQEPPSDPAWILGRIQRDYWLANAVAGMTKANSGKTYWSNKDLNICKKFDNGVVPGEGWVKGRLDKKELWNNGFVARRFPVGTIPDGDGWVKGGKKAPIKFRCNNYMVSHENSPLNAFNWSEFA
jgi:hypothetical protein